MKVYKLTDSQGKTHNDTQWGKNVTHQVNGKGKELCTPDVIHFYRQPLLAVIGNPIHANFDKPILWQAEADDIVAEDALKGGCKKLTTIKKIRLPQISLNAKVRFAIYCALEVYKDKDFKSWADKWLSGEDRAAWAAARAAAEATTIDLISLIEKSIKDEVAA